MNTNLRHHIERELNSVLINKSHFSWQSVGGGSINDCYKITATGNSFFVKINTQSVFENGFKEEVFGLQFLEKNNTLVPKIICEGSHKEFIYLVLEWIDSGNQTIRFWKNFACQLAKLHNHKGNSFGLEYSNYMGQLIQKNTFSNSFSDFFIKNRLEPQIALAFDNGLLEKKHISKFEFLYKQLPTIFPLEKPCAVHGDLWSGNFVCNKQEKMVLIDPAVYYGHREIDLAMSMLFGGFSQEFYTTYQEVYPLEKGFQNRKDIYNLYPLLIHLNLFGSSYKRSIETIIMQF